MAIFEKINGLIITPLVYSGLVAKAIVDGPETPCIRRWCVGRRVHGFWGPSSVVLAFLKSKLITYIRSH